MIADLEWMKKLTHGAVKITAGEEGFQFYRFTKQQMATYEPIRDFYGKAHAAAGIRFDLRTDAEKILLSCSFQRGGSSRVFAYVDAAVNGVLVQHSGTEDLRKEPDLEMEIPLDGKLNTVTIYLSGLSRVTVKKLEIIGAKQIEPVAKKRTMICFGDSITHGYDAVYPSLAYPNQLADALDAEMFNKGIGAEIFNPALLDEPDPVTPDLITVAYGTNDWSKCKAGELEQNATAFFDRLAALYPGVPIYAILPLWRKDMHRVTETGTFEDGRELVRKAAERHPQCRVIDGLQLTPHVPEFYSDLYLHPNDLGFMFMAQGILKEIRKDFADVSGD
ncbi:MAG: SGNH/GDSL hydrolase family protein [Lentisphaeria bacterium]|nr:SGNH/GDSL hydrolase family protein [Lentisphaeria bacterium]